MVSLAREVDTAPDTRRTHLKIELRTPTVNCSGKYIELYNWGRNDIGLRAKTNTYFSRGPMVAVCVCLFFIAYFDLPRTAIMKTKWSIPIITFLYLLATY